MNKSRVGKLMIYEKNRDIEEDYLWVAQICCIMKSEEWHDYYSAGLSFDCFNIMTGEFYEDYISEDMIVREDDFFIYWSIS